MIELNKIQQTNEYLSSLFWNPLRDLAIKRNTLKGKRYWITEDKATCCGCGTVVKKSKMHLTEYISHKVKNGRTIKVINKKYRCKRCSERYERKIK